jgi:hypothetical protein
MRLASDSDVAASLADAFAGSTTADVERPNSSSISSGDTLGNGAGPGAAHAGVDGIRALAAGGSTASTAKEGIVGERLPIGPEDPPPPWWFRTAVLTVRAARSYVRTPIQLMAELGQYVVFALFIGASGGRARSVCMGPGSKRCRHA